MSFFLISGNWFILVCQVVYFARYICVVKCGSIESVCLFLYSSCEWFACRSHWKRSRTWESAERGKNKRRRSNQNFYTTREPTSRLEKMFHLWGLSRNIGMCFQAAARLSFSIHSSACELSLAVNAHTQPHTLTQVLEVPRAQAGQLGFQRQRDAPSQQVDKNQEELRRGANTGQMTGMKVRKTTVCQLTLP